MLNKVIEAMQGLQEVKFNKRYGDQVIAEATETFNEGWEALEDGIVVSYKGNQVAVKKGNTMVISMMKDFSVNMGKLDGNIDHEVKVVEIPESKKTTYLAQAIITKYYTLKRA